MEYLQRTLKVGNVAKFDSFIFIFPLIIGENVWINQSIESWGKLGRVISKNLITKAIPNKLFGSK